MNDRKPNVLQVVGYKNAGKTTLVCEIVRLLSAAGVSVGTLKRDAHGADPEPEGADTRRHREAGAHIAALANDRRTMWTRERPSSLDELLAGLAESGAEAVIVEGFKDAPYPKLVLLRGDEDADLLGLAGVIGAAVRGPAPAAERKASTAGIPCFRTDGKAFGQLLEFIGSYWRLLEP